MSERTKSPIILALPLAKVDDICRHGEGENQCRYLARHEANKSWRCLKVIPHLKNIIDEEIALMHARYEDKRRDDKGLPLGDHCAGHGEEALVIV